MEVTIEGVRSATEPRLEGIALRYEIQGVDQATAERLVEVWRDR